MAASSSSPDKSTTVHFDKYPGLTKGAFVRLVADEGNDDVYECEGIVHSVDKDVVHLRDCVELQTGKKEATTQVKSASL